MLTASVTLVVIYLALSSYILTKVNGIDLNRALQNENTPCFVPRQLANVNETWLTSVDTWYYPLASVLELYLESMDISGKGAAELQEDELYYDACITYQIGMDRVTLSGFGGQQSTYHIEQLNGLRSFNLQSLDPGNSRSGTTYITLTDNRTFNVFTSCQEGRMTWGAVTTAKVLPVETVRRIHNHVSSMGFKREHFTGLRYDSCPTVVSRQQRKGNQGQWQNQGLRITNWPPHQQGRKAYGSF